MAIYHLSVSNVSRGSGANAIAAYAYISGEKAKNERTGLTYDYARKERIIATGNSVPEYAPAEFDEPEAWLNAAEKVEKAENARIANKIIVALPRELSLNEQIELIQNFVADNFAAKGYCATWAIHTDAENNNPHAHILAADRKIDKNGNWQKVKQKKVIARDVNGNRIPVLDENGKQKVRMREGKGEEKIWKRETVDANQLSSREGIEEIRKDWATRCNALLPQYARIDHRSFARQGRSELPQLHVGYAGWQNSSSDRWNENERRKSLNTSIRGLEEKIERARGVTYVCASFNDAAKVAGGENQLFRAITGTEAWKKSMRGRSKVEKDKAKKYLDKAINAGAKAGSEVAVVVSMQAGKVAASVIKASASLIKNTIGAIPIVGAPVKIAAAGVEGAAEGVKNRAQGIKDAVINKNAQNQQQRPQERQRQRQQEQEPPEEKEKESGSGSAPQMRDVDALDELLKYTDYKWLSTFEKEEVRVRQTRNEV